MGKTMKFFKTLFAVLTASFFTLTIQSADLNIATLDPQAALFSTNVAKKELEELENSDEWKEVVEELQAKATEAREIQERTQKDGPTMSDEEKQAEFNKIFASLTEINIDSLLANIESIVTPEGAVQDRAEIDAFVKNAKLLNNAGNSIYVCK